MRLCTATLEMPTAFSISRSVLCAATFPKSAARSRQPIPERVQVCPDDGACFGVHRSISAAGFKEARRVALAVIDLPVIRRAVFAVGVVHRRNGSPRRIVDNGHQAHRALTLSGPPFICCGQLVKVGQLVKNPDAGLGHELVKVMSAEATERGHFRELR